MKVNFPWKLWRTKNSTVSPVAIPHALCVSNTPRCSLWSPSCLPPDARNLFADFLDEESFFTSLGDVVCNCPFCHWSTHCATNFLTLSHVVCDGIGVCFDWCCVCLCADAPEFNVHVFSSTHTHFPLQNTYFLSRKKHLHASSSHSVRCVSWFWFTHDDARFTKISPTEFTLMCALQNPRSRSSSRHHT